MHRLRLVLLIAAVAFLVSAVTTDTTDISPVFNVTDAKYGAVADAVEATCSDVFNCSVAGTGPDDTAAFEAAFAAACSAGGGTVFVPLDTYRVIDVDVNCSNVELKCEIGARILPYGTAGGDLFQFCQETDCAGTNPIENIKVTGCHLKVDDPEEQGRGDYVIAEWGGYAGDGDGTVASFADYSGTVAGTVSVTWASTPTSLRDNTWILFTPATTSYGTGPHSFTKIGVDSGYFEATWAGSDDSDGEAINFVPKRGQNGKITGGTSIEVMRIDVPNQIVRIWPEGQTVLQDDAIERLGVGDAVWKLTGLDLTCSNCGLETTANLSGIYVESGNRITFEDVIFENLVEYSVRIDSAGAHRGNDIRFNGGKFLNCPGIPAIASSCVQLADVDTVVFNGTKLEGGVQPDGGTGSTATESSRISALVWIKAADETAGVTDVRFVDTDLVDEDAWGSGYTAGDDSVTTGIRISPEDATVAGVELLGGRLDVPTNKDASGAIWSDFDNPISGLKLSHLAVNGNLRVTAGDFDGDHLTQDCESSDFSAIAGSFSRFRLTHSSLTNCNKRSISFWAGSAQGPVHIEDVVFTSVGSTMDEEAGIIDLKNWTNFTNTDEHIIRDVVIRPDANADFDVHGINCGGVENVVVDNARVYGADEDCFNGCQNVRGSYCEGAGGDGIQTLPINFNVELVNNVIKDVDDDGIDLQGGFATVKGNTIINPGGDAIQDDAAVYARCMDNRSLGQLTVFSVLEADITGGTIAVGDDVALEGGGGEGYIVAVNVEDTTAPRLWIYTAVLDNIADGWVTTDELTDTTWTMEPPGITVIDAGTAVSAIDCDSTGSTEVDNEETYPAP